jgi:hypothetical protein
MRQSGIGQMVVSHGYCQADHTERDVDLALMALFSVGVNKATRTPPS